jgi:ribosomal protein S18 acetylase RimI-like enzyme
MSCRVRAVRSFGDIQELVAIHNAVWNHSIGIIDLLAESTECYLAVDAEGEGVAGYAFVQQDLERGFFELNDIAVAPLYRGAGYGGQLMRHLMNRCRHVKLCVRARKKKLVGFYARLGFRQETVFENYYGIGDDALRMAWCSERAFRGRRRSAAPTRDASSR